MIAVVHSQVLIRALLRIAIAIFIRNAEGVLSLAQVMTETFENMRVRNRLGTIGDMQYLDIVLGGVEGESAIVVVVRSAFALRSW